MADKPAVRHARSRVSASGAHDWVLTALLALTFLLGGGSRYDIVSLVILRPLSFVALTYALYRAQGATLRGFKIPIALLCAWTMLIMAQLVPLPPGVWTALPGREAIVASFKATGAPLGWQPLTVVPFATINSLLAMCLPLAVLLLFAVSSTAGRRRALHAIAWFAVASALFGILQVVTGDSGRFYPFAITNRGTPVGFFANRNHQAAVLAVAIPLILAIAANRSSSHNGTIAWVGRAIALGLIVVVVMTGSRAGTALALVALVVGSLLLTSFRAQHPSERKMDARRFERALALASRWAVPGILAASVAVVFLISRGTAFERLANKDSLGDLRFEILPTVLDMVRSSFPFGYGFGTFPWVYDIFEPLQQMRDIYINRAHDDWLEIFIEGGVFTPMIALAYVVWFARRCWQVRRSFASPAGDNDRYLLVAALGILVLVGASLFDYPLRTPSVAAILMVLVGCLAAPRRA